MDALHPREVEGTWLRCVFLLALLVALFALARHATWPVAASETLPVSNATGASELLFPLAGFKHVLRDNFHEKRGVRTHKALDIMAPRGTPVRAVDDGTIARLYRGPMAGIAVYQFDPGMKRAYFYAHLDRHAPGLAAGTPVKRGEIIGYVGSTGNAPESAPHLHFEMRALGDDKRWWRGTAINPYPLLRIAGD